MQWHKIDLLNESIEPATPQKHTKRIRRKLVLFLIILLVGVYGLYVKNINVTSNGDSEADWNVFSTINIFKTLSALTSNNVKPLEGEDDDRINILLLGVGGVGHEGGLLADTIMLASYKPSIQKASLVSIPRDLSVPIPGYGWRKINNINAIGETKAENGAAYSAQMLSDLFDIPIQYYFRIDFTGFEEFIDALDGIDVYVENTLDDYKYPVTGKEDADDVEERYEHLHIDRGQQHMDGALALKYARSRHADGIEGSDFARAKRQQNVIEAVKDKLLSIGTFVNPKKIGNILDALESNLSTNMEVWEMIRIYKEAKDIETADIIQKVLDNSPQGLLVDARYEGAYVLEPRAGDFSEIRKLISTIFDDELEVERDGQKVVHAKVLDPEPEKIVPPTLEPGATVEIQNGTLINGLAGTNQRTLEELGINVIKVGNAATQDGLKGYFYDYSYDSFPKTKDFLQQHYGYAIDNGNDLDEDLRTTDADFLIILGP